MQLFFWFCVWRVKTQNSKKTVKIALTDSLLEAHNMARLHSFTQSDNQLTCLWEQERFVWTPERTQQMRMFTKMLKALLRADEIEIFIDKGARRFPKPIEYHKLPTREGNGEEQTDYQLGVGNTLVHVTRTCYTP
jgi:hypothetical protein